MQAQERQAQEQLGFPEEPSLTPNALKKLEKLKGSLEKNVVVVFFCFF